MAFFGSYVFHGLVVYPIVSRLSGFRWSVANGQTGLLFLSSIAMVFGGFYV
jgi:PST family polysaccharide transporter